MENIYLVGFMCTGKTEVARLLARRLKCEFIDMDALIEEREEMPIASIFKKKGEPYFRKVEKEMVAEIAAKTGAVVACGGGAFAVQENVDVLKKSGIVICLTSTPEMILKRAPKTGSRPLLNVADPRRAVEELLKKRAPFYTQAHLTIDADQLTVQETAEKILHLLNLHE